MANSYSTSSSSLCQQQATPLQNNHGSEHNSHQQTAPAYSLAARNAAFTVRWIPNLFIFIFCRMTGLILHQAFLFLFNLFIDHQYYVHLLLFVKHPLSTPSTTNLPLIYNKFSLSTLWISTLNGTVLVNIPWLLSVLKKLYCHLHWAISYKFGIFS